MKHEWRKREKGIYLPGTSPEVITVPAFKYYTIEGQGNPNDDKFPDYIAALYSLSYGIKMSPKKGYAPYSYTEYTVYPLEGVWDINEKAKVNYSGVLDKDILVFKLMIRQPDFVDASFANFIIEEIKKKKPHPLLDQVKFEIIEEGPCVQMMHVGSYDNEPRSFKTMEAFADKEGLVRKSKVHREIYLSDARKVIPEKLKTILRFKVNKG